MARTQINPSLSSGLTTFASPQNILDNGGFEIWQRGTSFSSPANGTYLADRWLVTHITPNPTYTVSQSSSTVYNGLYSMQINITNYNSTPFIQFLQYIENYQAYASQTITLSMAVWANATGANLELASASGNFAESANHPGDSQWHILTVTYTVAATPTFLFIAFNPTQNGTYYLDAGMLILGSTASNFVPTHPEVDLARCQRYYEIDNGVASRTAPIPGFNNTNIIESQDKFSVVKRVAPTVTYGNISVAISNISGTGQSVSGAPISDS